jgi:hypothetical protein
MLGAEDLDRNLLGLLCVLLYLIYCKYGRVKVLITKFQKNEEKSND